MSKSLSSFAAVEDIDGLFTAERGALRCTAVRLKSGGLCLYSPVAGLGEEARASLSELGEVTVLVAPNHYHNKAVAEYVETFPAARLCSSAAAKARLKKITGLTFGSLDRLHDDLPSGIDILTPEGLKTGEIWIRVSAGGHVVWIVTDAFSGPKGVIGAYADEVQLLGTFPKFGVADKDIYGNWFDKTIAAAPPGLIIPCHGSMVRSPNLAHDMAALINDCL